MCIFARTIAMIKNNFRLVAIKVAYGGVVVTLAHTKFARIKVVTYEITFAFIILEWLIVRALSGLH